MAMPNTFFTSDLHFGHQNIIEYCNRPWATADEMNRGLVRLWNDMVSPDDIVWFLGDAAMRVVPDDTLRFIAMLNGTIHLVAGNHDKCWEGHKKVGDWPQRYLDAGFASIQTEASIEIAGQHVQMCHFPYQGDSHDEDRYVDHRPEDRGAWLLHGHVHDEWDVNGRQINVGCDVRDYRPMHIDEIARIITAA